MSREEPLNGRDVDAALRKVLTPEFDAELKRLLSLGKGPSPFGAICDTTEGVCLRKSIDELYATFEPYSMSDPFDYCDHCIGPDDVARLQATPLKDLTHDDLWMVATNIMATIGEAQDLKYFLPRIIEGAVEGAAYDVEVVFGATDRAGFAMWRSDERDSIGRYVHAQAAANLMTEPFNASGVWEMSTLLCSASMLRLPLATLLDGWAEDTRPLARRHLLEYVRRDVAISDALRLANPWWTRATEAEVATWLRTPQTRAALDSALLNMPASDSWFEEVRTKIQRLNT